MDILPSLDNPFGAIGGGITPPQILNLIANVLVGASFALGTVAIIVSGIQYSMSQGDIKAIDTSKKYLTAGVIALILSIGAMALRRILANSIGASGIM